MKHPRIPVGSGIALILALSCLFGASSPSRYILAQASDPQASVVTAGLAGTPAGTVFTYQGQLTDGGAPANGSYDFVFELFEVATGGSHMGIVNVDDVVVTDGLFTVQLDFGAGKFTGDARWLEIYVRPGASADPYAYVQLAPRQPLTPAPYAINASTVGGLAAGDFATATHNHWGQAWTGTGKALDLTGSAPAPILAATNINTVTGAGIAGISTASNGVYGESAHGDGVSGKGGEDVGNFGGRFTGRAGVRGEGGAGVGGYFTSTGNDAVHAQGDVTITGDLAVQGTANIAHYAQTVIVAKSGGDFTTIQAAVTSITDAGANKPYLVWVAPGVYSEMVTLKPHVHLQGAGREATLITSNVGNLALPPSQATLILDSSTSVRDLSIENTGANADNIAVLVLDDAVDVLVADVTAWAQGAGADASNYGIFVSGPSLGESAEVWLENVTARGENGGGTGYCYGLYISYATVHIRGGSYHGLPLGTTRGSKGITVVGATAALDAEDVTALGVGGQNYNYGLYIDDGSTMLQGGSFTGRGGQNAIGIDLSLGALTATAVTVLAEESTSQVNGLHFGSTATATLYGGSFIGRSGLYTMGINGSDGALVAENVTCVAELGLEYGSTRGLSLVAQEDDTLSATLHGGSYTARNHASSDAEGIFVSSNGDGVVTLVADHISATGAGSNSRGLEVSEATNTVEISESVLRGANNSVKHSDATVTIANSRLEGVTSGAPTCVAVSRGTTFNASGCP